MLPLAITHSTILTSIGAGKAKTLENLRARKTGLQPCDFDMVELSTYLGAVCEIDDAAITGDLAQFDCRNNRLASKALALDGFDEAVAKAREKYGAHRIGVFLGTSTAGILTTEIAYRMRGDDGGLPGDFPYAGTHSTFSVASFVSAAMGLAGPSAVISAACASTSKAFGNAARMIALGLCDAAIVGGADSLCLTTLYGFNSLMLVSPQPCRPFGANRDGISIGEGAGFVLLEKAGDDDNIHFIGIGESSDAHHMSSPHPEGRGARLAMENALESASLAPGDIDYVNLHGTATQVGDAAEDRAISDLFGSATPCSSIKGFTGHTLGASGVVEAIISMLALEHGFMPGTAGTDTFDPQMKSALLRTGVHAPLARVMSNSFGFGGSNCSVIFGRA